jgi:polyphosphate glucokinase
VNVLVVDIGGTNIKVLATDEEVSRKTPSVPRMSPTQMVAAVLELTADWAFDVVAMGYPGAVRGGRPAADPVNLGEGWVDFDYTAGFGKPTRIINDAAMQALGAYEGGHMLFLGLGTGLGSAMVIDGAIAPMELGHLPYRGRTFEDYVGVRGLLRLGKKRWRAAVADVVATLTAALQPDYVMLGGGNAKRLKQLPPNARLGTNADAFAGGFRLWDPQPPPNPQTQWNPEPTAAAHADAQLG